MDSFPLYFYTSSRAVFSDGWRALLGGRGSVQVGLEDEIC